MTASSLIPNFVPFWIENPSPSACQATPAEPPTHTGENDEFADHQLRPLAQPLQRWLDLCA
ncbi:MAG: hypothetical protein ACK4RK_13120 [Gemmataceae bacterium]